MSGAGNNRMGFRRLCVGVMVLATLAFHHYFRLVRVYGRSMDPTFRAGDVLLVARRGPFWKDLQRGSVVLVRVGDEIHIKRIVGLPGEVVEVRDGQVHVDRRPVATGEPESVGCLSIAAGRLGADRYALLGDNRWLPASMMQHAVVSQGQIVGRVIRRLGSVPWPPVR